MRYLVLVLVCLLSFYDCNCQQAICDNKYNEIAHLSHWTEDRILQSRGNINIKLIFHILLEDTSLVTDQDIYYQIERLNEDFCDQNNDSFSSIDSSLNTRCMISFCLAGHSEIAGKAIRRIHYLNSSILEDLFIPASGGSEPYFPGEFINIYVTDLQEPLYGFASSPFDSIIVSNDAIVIDYKRLPSRNYSYDSKGRTLVHEMGHFFGLNHSWGVSGTCDIDDGIDDTPTQKNPYYFCPSEEAYSCNSHDMFYNLMDYTEDQCRTNFTKGQMAFMLSTLLHLRVGLLQSNEGCSENINNKGDAYTIYPNPVHSHLMIRGDFKDKSELGVRILDYNGRMMKFEILEPFLNSNLKVNVAYLKSGIYILRISDINLSVRFVKY